MMGNRLTQEQWEALTAAERRFHIKREREVREIIDNLNESGRHLEPGQRFVIVPVSDGQFYVKALDNPEDDLA